MYCTHGVTRVCTGDTAVTLAAGTATLGHAVVQGVEQ